MLIDISYFFGAITIPNLGTLGVVGDTISKNLYWFIGTYEPEYLELVLGKSLADALQEGLVEVEGVDTPDKWLTLKNKIVDSTLCLSPIAGYVYYHWMRDRLTSSVSGGESQSKSENAERVINTDKMMTAYNNAIKAGKVIREWVEAHKADYPEYVLTDEEEEDNSLEDHMNNYGL